MAHRNSHHHKKPKSSKRGRHVSLKRKGSPKRRSYKKLSPSKLSIFPVHGQGRQQIQRQKRKFQGKNRMSPKLNPWF